MNNNYNGNNTGLGLDGVVNQPNPGFGLDGVVNQPNSGFGLPEEQVQSVEAVQPVQPMEPVQSVPTVEMQYVNHPKQPIRVENRALDPVLVEKIKQTAKKAIAALATLGVTAGIVMGAHQALTQPEFVPNQTPQSIEFQEDLKNEKNINEAIDITNEHKESQEGVIPHEAIEDLKTKEQQARQMQELVEQKTVEKEQKEEKMQELVEQKTVEKEQKEEKMQELREKAVKNSNMSESMQNFVDEVNRQKVIKIESGKTIHPEQVVDSSDVVGGRGL